MFPFFREGNNGSRVLARRFFQVFREHGVAENQISSLLPAISLAATSAPDKLLEALTPEALEQTSQLFGIRRQWLEGVTDEIYLLPSCYKSPERFFEFLAPLNLHDYPLRILSTYKRLDRHGVDDQRLVLVLVEKIAKLGEQEVNRYHLFAEGWRWNYEPTRIQVKALARVFHHQFRKPIPIFQVPPKIIDELEAGRLIPHKHVQGSMCPDPCLEDYAISTAESYVAKEVDELPQVLEYITVHKLDELAGALHAKSLDQVQNDEASNHSAPETESAKPSGKRAQAGREIWGPIEAIVQVWWAEEGESLSICQAISRIKSLPQLKASSSSESSIRKHIAQFAPKVIRKAGRRPKKSPNMQ